MLPLALDLEHGAGAPRRDRVMTTLRTPGHDVELAVGWLRSEGVIGDAADVHAAAPCATAASAGQDVLRVRLRPGVRVDLARTVRIGTITAACGACGRPDDASIAAGGDPATTSTALDGPAFSLAALLAAPDRMLEAQPGFRHSGGLHAAALVAPDGRILVVREDVGRHNAVDKVIGAWMGIEATEGRRNGDLATPPPMFADVALLVSSRAGYEIVQKATGVGIRVVAAVGAASSLAIDAATAAGITLAGFVRESRCSVYAHAEGLDAAGASTRR